jgi:preprotein translocase subunit SecA
MITRALEKAQTKIEELNFDARKQVLSYDDVLNIQRKSIYGRRKSMLTGGNEAIDEELIRLYSDNDEITEIITEKKKKLGDDIFYLGTRRLLLQTIDLLWVEHLETMDYLRSSVNLRAYGQRDPLVEYKKEGLQLFRALEVSYKEQVARHLPQMEEGGFAKKEAQNLEDVHKSARGITQGSSAPMRVAEKIGRNIRVKITDGKETKELKYKKAEELLASGKWRIVEK